ncbi:centromere protein C [Vipera latastei]
MNSLNHLKNTYRLRFFNGLRKKNATDIQRESVLECVEDCFELDNKVSEEIQENDIEVWSLGSPILLEEDGEKEGEREEEDGEKSCAKDGPLCSNEVFRREWNPFNTDDSDSDKSADLEENLHRSVSNSLKHKLILPTNTPNVRRSKRTRIKPLQYWRGERIDYKISPSGGFVIGGIISPEQRESRKPKAKVAMKSVSEMENLHNNSIFMEDFSQPAVVFDKASNQQIILECMNNGSSPVYCINNEKLSIYKYLNTPSFSSGKIILNPLKEKGYQYSYTDTLVFYISCGKLLLMLYDQSYCLTAGNYFFIPPGNVYNIRNLLNKECVIFFTQLKGKEK